MSNDTRNNFIEKLSLDNFRVDLTMPIIFLCGGEVDIKNVS